MPTDNKSTRPIWFPAKRFGWGWGPPVVWQGWVVLISWMVIVTGGSLNLAGRNWLGFAAFMLVMCVALIAICLARGETPRWRWGKSG